MIKELFLTNILVVVTVILSRMFDLSPRSPFRASIVLVALNKELTLLRLLLQLRNNLCKRVAIVFQVLTQHVSFIVDV